MEFRVLELFSGIGGMHYAFKYTKLSGKVVTAMDINTVANAVYSHNYKFTPVLNTNIVGLTAQTLEKLGVNMVLMSPPCQPHTRIGHKKDEADHRSKALTHLCLVLAQSPAIEYILMENVKGFETSQARNSYVKMLEQSKFYWREFILSPTQMGVPNTRHRYYCIARKKKDFTFSEEHIWKTIPIEFENTKNQNNKISKICHILEPENEISNEMLVPDNVLSKRVWLMDIVTASASNTMCFTKAYTHYSEGTGSVFTPLNAEDMKIIFEKVKYLEEQKDDEKKDLKRLQLLKSLNMRYFTPREILRLMSFPETFTFPDETTNRQKFRLLGNSINVCVVGELIKLLCM